VPVIRAPLLPLFCSRVLFWSVSVANSENFRRRQFHRANRLAKAIIRPSSAWASAGKGTRPTCGARTHCSKLDGWDRSGHVPYSSKPPAGPTDWGARPRHVRRISHRSSTQGLGSSVLWRLRAMRGGVAGAYHMDVSSDWFEASEWFGVGAQRNSPSNSSTLVFSNKSNLSLRDVHMGRLAIPRSRNGWRYGFYDCSLPILTQVSVKTDHRECGQSVIMGISCPPASTLSIDLV